MEAKQNYDKVTDIGIILNDLWITLTGHPCKVFGNEANLAELISDTLT